MKKTVLLGLAIATTTYISAQTPTTDPAKSQNEVVTADKVEWGWLNPLRGDKSPAAGKLWGDRTKNGPAGFLVKFKKGFSSPPHIHNITYRGVVIEGLLHNDDEKAKEQLATTTLSVSEIAYQLGFEHSQSFSKLFKSKTNYAPLKFRQTFH